MVRQPPFDGLAERRDLQARLNELPGVQIPDDALDKRPSIALATLTDEAAVESLLACMDWAIEQAQASAQRWSELAGAAGD
jgi:hypothetical protein